MSDTFTPGEIQFGEGDLVLNAGREAIELQVTNTGDRAVQIGSHFHFFEVNRALRFARRQAFGMRLNVPSGTSVRFEAGQTHRVSLVPYGGTRQVVGFNGLTARRTLQQAVDHARTLGFEIEEEAAE